MQLPRTQYARSGNLNIAYQVFGEGDQHLIFVPGWVSNIEEAWSISQLAAWMKYLAGFTRMVIFDKRGTGLSDNVNENDLPNQQQRIEDLEAVIHAEGIKKAVLFGLSEGGPLAILFAKKFPEFVQKIILYGSFPKWIKSQDYPFGLTIEQHKKIREYIFDNWGSPVGLHLMAPSTKDDPISQEQWARFLRRSASPSTARVLYEMNISIDVRPFLGEITCPVLIIHRKDDQLIASNHSRFLHQQIPNSQLYISLGQDHLPWYGWKSSELTLILSFIRDETVTKKIPKGLSPEDLFTLFEIRDFLRSHFAKDISISFLCKKFGMNDFKLKQGFKSLFQTSPIAFLTSQRMVQAQKLLESPGESVTSVAEKCGYKHANNFSNAFKREFGITPKDFQRSIG